MKNPLRTQRLKPMNHLTTDSWAAYKNEESEINDFVEWIGGTPNDWAERGNTKWVMRWGNVELLFFPNSGKQVIQGEKLYVGVMAEKYKTFIQAKQKAQGRKVEKT